MVLFVLAILSFIIIFGMKMQNNYEMDQYYSEKQENATQELAALPEANGQEQDQLQEFFVITDKEIDVMNKATEILHAMNDFDEWCTNNFETHAPQCYNVFEDFLIKNGGIISQIEKVKNNN